ncbi:MAG: DNA primase [Spirochaetaceae bacterium]|nr:DNA primase [Spirochaetaceae bacterium]
MKGRISSDTIQQVMERTDVTALIGEYTRLERRGDEWWGCCPFHNEKTPSFKVDPSKGLYYCFGCHEGGNTVDFVCNMEKLSYREAIVFLAKLAGVEVVYSGAYQSQSQENSQRDSLRDQFTDLYTRVAGSYHYCLTSTPEGKQALDYILDRGITLETVQKFQLGYSPANRRWLRVFLKGKNYSDEFLDQSGLFSKKYPNISFFSHRLMFPICDRQGRVVAFGGRLLAGEGPKYINSGDLVQYQKGKTLYAFHHARQSIRKEKAVIFCEGYMDVLAYHQCGLTHAVAPLGTALTMDQVKLVQPFVEQVYLSFDTDQAGREATLKAILLCRQADIAVRVIALEGGKDPAEIMVNSGSKALTEFVNSARIDGDYLLSLLATEHQIETPEGKTKAALAFFPYVDALKSDIQRESWLTRLCQELDLNIEAVRKDFIHRETAEKRVHEPKVAGGVVKPLQIRMNAELRAVLAVVANLDAYEQMRTDLSPEDFEDPVARELFIILEECYREESVLHGSVLAKCSDEQLKSLVARAVASGEYADNQDKVIKDSIRHIRRNSLERKRIRLLNKIRQLSLTATTYEDQRLLEELISEKMSIDFELDNKDVH